MSDHHDEPSAQQNYKFSHPLQNKANSSSLSQFVHSILAQTPAKMEQSLNILASFKTSKINNFNILTVPEL